MHKCCSTAAVIANFQINIYALPHFNATQKYRKSAFLCNSNETWHFHVLLLLLGWELKTFLKPPKSPWVSKITTVYGSSHSKTNYIWWGLLCNEVLSFSIYLWLPLFTVCWFPMYAFPSQYAGCVACYWHVPVSILAPTYFCFSPLDLDFWILI